MAWTFVASASNYAAASGTALNTSTALNVSAGDVLIAYAGWQDAVSGDTVTIDQSDGTDAFTMVAATKAVQASDIGGAMGYLVAAGADAAFTVRFTLSAAGIRRGILVLQFTPDAGDTIAVDGATVAVGSSAALDSGSITTAGSDVLVACGGAHASGIDTGRQYAGVNDDGSDLTANVYYGLWYRVTTDDGAATSNAGGNDNWVCSVMGLSATAGGGGGRTTKNTRSHPLGISVGMGWRLPA